MSSKGASRQQVGTGRIDASEIKYSITGNIGSIGNQGTQHNVAAEVRGNQSIGNTDTAVTIEAIQQLLAQATQANPNARPLIVADAVVEQIEARPGLKQKAIAAAKQSGLEALKAFGPVGAGVAGAIEGWANT